MDAGEGQCVGSGAEGGRVLDLSTERLGDLARGILSLRDETGCSRLWRDRLRIGVSGKNLEPGT